MSPYLWIITPLGLPYGVDWALAVELDYVGLQRLSFSQWKELEALTPCPL